MYVCTYIYICIHTCMTYKTHIRYVCNIRVCMYVCMHACMHACMHVCMYVCMYVINVCMYVCMYVCMHACMHACMYVCVYIYIYIHIYIYIYILCILSRVCAAKTPMMRFRLTLRVRRGSRDCVRACEILAAKAGYNSPRLRRNDKYDDKQTEQTFAFLDVD